jgi:hypothetical protein
MVVAAELESKILDKDLPFYPLLQTNKEILTQTQHTC